MNGSILRTANLTLRLLRGARVGFERQLVATRTTPRSVLRNFSHSWNLKTTNDLRRWTIADIYQVHWREPNQPDPSTLTSRIDKHCYPNSYGAKLMKSRRLRFTI